MFAEICYYYPGYTVEKCMKTGLPTLLLLYRSIGKILERDPRVLLLKGLAGVG